MLELLAALNSPLEAEDALGRTVMQMAVDSGNQAIVASLAKREREQATAFHSQLRRQETTISSSGSSVSMMAAGPIGLGILSPSPAHFLVHFYVFNRAWQSFGFAFPLLIFRLPVTHEQ